MVKTIDIKGAFLFVLVMVVLMAAASGAAYAVSCGDTIYTDTVLTNDLIDCSGHGLIIGSDDITLDCNGHLVDGTYASGGYGIYLNHKQGVSVNNCEVGEFEYGIRVYDSKSCTLFNNLLSNNPDGIQLWNSNHSTLRNNNFTNNQDGMHIAYYSENNNVFDNTFLNNNIGLHLGSYYNNISNSRFENNNDGIQIARTSYNNLFNNSFYLNTRYGVFIYDSSSYNTLWDNDFELNGFNSYEDARAVNNNWNNTDIGNYWDDFETNPGYPDYYKIPGDGGGIDWHPRLPIKCGDTIYENTTLTNDLINCTGNGINIGADNIILDCNGHLIDGVNVSYGINLSNRTRVTIKNCDVRQFDSGVRVYYGSNNTLTSNTANNNYYGFELYFNSNNNALTSNTANNNSWGFSLTSSSNNTLTSNTANNNIGGFELYSSNNTLTNNTANNNGHEGIWLSSSYNNVLIGNTANNNSANAFHLYSSSSNTLTNNNANNNNMSAFYLFPRSNNNLLIGNTANNNTDKGFLLSSSSNGNTLTNNTANNNSGGFYLSSSSNNILTSNMAKNNRYDGFQLYPSSNNNTLTSNTANNNSGGFYLQDSSNIVLIGNTANNNSGGFYLYRSSNDVLTDNIAKNNRYDGFQLLYSSSNNTLTSNTANNNSEGFFMQFSSNNTLTSNTANNNNDEGFYLYSSNSSNFIGNTISNNRLYGLYFWGSSIYNTIYNNNFTDNGVNAYESNTSTNNSWNYTDIGNYWDDFESNPGYPDYYDIEPGSGIDWWPIWTFPSQDTIKWKYPAYGQNGTILSRIVTLQCEVNLSQNQSITNVTFYYNTTLIGWQNSTDASEYNLTWDTTATPDGNYTLICNGTSPYYTWNYTSSATAVLDNTAPILQPGNAVLPVNGSNISNNTYLVFETTVTERTLNTSATTVSYKRQGTSQWNTRLLTCAVEDTINYTCNVSADVSTLVADGDILQYFFDVNDSASHQSQIGTASVPMTLTVDLTNPAISLDAPANNANSTTGQFTFQWTANDTNIAVCKWYTNITGTWALNYTNSSPVSGTQETHVFTLSRVNGISVAWGLWCNDTSGRSTWATNRTVFVDAITPNLTLSMPLNNSFAANRTLEFMFTATDERISSCVLYTNRTGTKAANFTINATEGGSLVSGTQNGVNLTFGSDLNNLTWEVRCNDTFGNLVIANASLAMDTTAPTVTVGYPPNASYDNDGTVTMTYTPTDINIAICRLYHNGTLMNTSYYEVSGSPRSYNQSMADQTVNYSVVCNDSARNLGYTVNYTLYVDNTEPMITTLSPVNGTWSASASVTFVYTPSDTNGYGMSRCIIYNNRTGVFTANYTNSSPSSSKPDNQAISMVDGEYRWDIWCNDTAGNGIWQNGTITSRRNYTLYIDTTAPVLHDSSILNGSFTKETTAYGMSIILTERNVNSTLNVTVWFARNVTGAEVWFKRNMSCSADVEEHLCTYALDLSVFGMDAPGDKILVFFNTTDRANNPGADGSQSSYYYFIVDTEAPTISLSGPANNSWVKNSSTVAFFFTPVEQNSSLMCQVFTNNTGTWHINLNISAPVTGQMYIANITLPDNNNILWNVRCNDSAGNEAWGTNRTVRLDITAPTITLNFPEDGARNTTKSLGFIYTPIDTNLTNCSLYMNDTGSWGPRVGVSLINGTLVSGTTNNFTFQVENYGRFIWNVECYDLAGNSGWGASNFTLTVAEAQPDLTPISFTASSYELLPGQVVTYTLDIENTGDADSGAFYSKINFSPSKLPWGGLYTADLAQGETNRFIRQTAYDTPGIYTVTAIVDSRYSIDESDETNNIASIQVTVIEENESNQTGMPDLAPYSLTASRYNLLVNETVVYSLGLENIGDASSGSFYTNISFSPTMPPWIGILTQNLDPQQTVVLRRQTKYDAPGTYEVKATADWKGQVDESDETNNVQSIYVYVS